MNTTDFPELYGMLVYYHLVFGYASYQCHHCCFLNIGNTHWCSRDNSFFFESAAAAGAMAMEMRLWNVGCTKGRTRTSSVKKRSVPPDPLLIMMLPLFNLCLSCCLTFLMFLKSELPSGIHLLSVVVFGGIWMTGWILLPTAILTMLEATIG